MGRDTTASKRMAAKRSREKAAGLRRLNVAVRPEVLDKLAALMKLHNCASQASVIELLVLDSPKAQPVRKAKEESGEVAVKKTTAKRKETTKKQKTKKQQSKNQKKVVPAKAPKGKNKPVTPQKESSPTQMSLF